MRNVILLRPGRAIWLIASLIVLLTVTSACAEAETPPELRIRNSGTEDIRNLSILFPGPTADSEAVRVKYGDVAAGSTTAYQVVPSGVYRYAAYEYTLNGRLVSQPVVDWMGESPMQGRQFTYRIELDVQKPTGGQIQLAEVSVDTP